MVISRSPLVMNIFATTDTITKLQHIYNLFGPKDHLDCLGRMPTRLLGAWSLRDAGKGGGDSLGEQTLRNLICGGQIDYMNEWIFGYKAINKM
jgi:hypothetical protein